MLSKTNFYELVFLWAIRISSLEIAIPTLEIAIPFLEIAMSESGIANPSLGLVFSYFGNSISTLQIAIPK